MLFRRFIVSMAAHLVPAAVRPIGSRRMARATIMVSLVLLSACGGSKENVTKRFELCGNGVLDDHEECDDGNRADNDACLSSCLLSTCGDEFVYVGAEECDGRNLNPLTGNFNLPYNCGNLGFAGGTLQCDPACRLDTSACGPAFTPTPTHTAPPTSTPTSFGQPSETPTATPSPTSTPNPSCGNGDIEPGETCDDGNVDDNDACPSDCRILPCTPSATTLGVQVNFLSPEFQDASSITVLLTYPDGVVSLPGTGGDTTVSQRIVNRQSGSTVTPNDLDHALRVVYSRPGRITIGRIFVVNFDQCEDAASPGLETFGCIVTGCSNSFGEIEGCTCTVDFP